MWGNANTMLRPASKSENYTRDAQAEVNSFHLCLDSVDDWQGDFCRIARCIVRLYILIYLLITNSPSIDIFLQNFVKNMEPISAGATSNISTGSVRSFL